MNGDSAYVNIAYYAIMRRYQMQNLNQYDSDEQPTFADLEGYQSHNPPDRNYYSPRDYFFELGEKLRDMNVERQRSHENAKKESQKRSTLHKPRDREKTLKFA